MNLTQGRFRLDSRKFYTQRVILELEQAPQGSGHSTKPEFKKHWDSALSHRVGLLGCPVQDQELDSMILMDPFQLSMLYDSIKVLLE